MYIAIHAYKIITSTITLLMNGSNIGDLTSRWLHASRSLHSYNQARIEPKMVPIILLQCLSQTMLD